MGFLMESRERLEDVFAESTVWSDQTFPQSTPQSIANHLLSEAKELQQNPFDVSEIADVLLLLAHLASRVGVDLAKVVRIKFEINKQRKWGEVNEEGFVEHVREEKEEPISVFCPPSLSTYEIDKYGNLTGRKLIYWDAALGNHSWKDISTSPHSSNDDLLAYHWWNEGRQFREGKIKVPHSSAPIAFVLRKETEDGPVQQPTRRSEQSD